MALKRLAQASLAVITGIAENVSPSDEIFVITLDEKVAGVSSAKATLSRGFEEP